MPPGKCSSDQVLSSPPVTSVDGYRPLHCARYLLAAGSRREACICNFAQGTCMPGYRRARVSTVLALLVVGGAFVVRHVRSTAD